MTTISGQLSAVAVFDELRTARFNRYVHEYQMRRYRRLNTGVDLVTMLAISTVGVGIWVEAMSPSADVVIKAVSLLAAALSIYQVVMRPGDVASAHEAHLAVYESLDSTLLAITRRISVGSYSDTVLGELESHLRSATAIHLPRVSSPPEHVSEKAFARVNQEIPPSFFAK